MSSIEKIRAEVAEILAIHEDGSCPLCPPEGGEECAFAILAQNYLRLVEALVTMPCDCGFGHRANAQFCPYGLAERVLAEVAR